MIWQQICRLGAFSCILCRETDARGLNLCEICTDLLPTTRAACLRCAIPLFPSDQSVAPSIPGLVSVPGERDCPEVTATDPAEFKLVPDSGSAGREMPLEGRPICGQCLTGNSPIRRTYSRFRYESPVTDLIHQLKFGGRLVLARTLGSLLVEAIPVDSQNDIDLLIPMPMTARRRCSRGFNQAEEIARFTAAEVNLPFNTGTLLRHGHQSFQAGLNRRQRRQNVKGVFSVSGPVAGLRLVLIDDVMTTGATVNAAVNSLLRAGALSVDVWVVARTG